jgi:hypothetical protein
MAQHYYYYTAKKRIRLVKKNSASNCHLQYFMSLFIGDILFYVTFPQQHLHIFPPRLSDSVCNCLSLSLCLCLSLSSHTHGRTLTLSH